MSTKPDLPDGWHWHDEDPPAVVELLLLVVEKWPRSKSPPQLTTRFGGRTGAHEYVVFGDDDALVVAWKVVTQPIDELIMPETKRLWKAHKKGKTT